MKALDQKQKTIGMIGGTSWESTVLYYKLINEQIRDRLGGINSAKILLYSFNYEPIVKLELEGNWPEVGKQLALAAKTVQDAGADFLILCCNTLHKAVDSIEAAIQIPFLHIADAAGILLSKKRIKKMGLLGTQFTMEDGFYASRLKEKFELEVLIPSSLERKILDQIIYNELCQGKVLPSSKKQILDMIGNLQQMGAEAILLGCTELGILIQENDAAIPIYDTTLLHAKQAADLSLSTNPFSNHLLGTSTFLP